MLLFIQMTEMTETIILERTLYFSKCYFQSIHALIIKTYFSDLVCEIQSCHIICLQK